MKQYLIFMVVLLSVLLVGCNTFVEKECPTQECSVCKECPEEQAMLLSMFDSWGENIDNPSEILFDNYIYNFGDVEAKNIVLVCNVTNSNGDTEFTESKNIGNVASNSYVYKEVAFKYKVRDEDSNGVCYIKSCDNCVILLDKIKAE